MRTKSKEKQGGFTLIELLVVVVVIGIMFFFLIDAINVDDLQAKAKNVSVQTAMTKIVLSVNSYINSYSRVPNESEFLQALTSSTQEYEDSCTVRGFPTYECLFKMSSREMPSTCDLSGWRSDSDKNLPCNMRYYAGNALSSNSLAQTNFRLYAKAFGKDNSFFVFDSLQSGVLFKCPAFINDFDTLEECYAL